MIPPAGYAIAAITLMLWIVWSDTIRSRRPSPILYAFRIVIFLTLSFILVFNMMRYPGYFSTSARVLVFVAAGIGLFGAGYFGRKLVRRNV
jgi:asparagine N-glycosylation enzyme membrane subunit Stt3